MSFSGSRLEISDEEIFCKELFCRLNGTMSVSTGESAVDGTKCGENKWCFQNKCVQEGQRPKAINGGWSDWSKPTACSRTCGGGITFSERLCNNPIPANGGRFCTGEGRKIWICNTDHCPFGEPTFRDVQCATGNAKSSEGPWKAYFNEKEPCVLFCINDQSIIRKIQPRAKDGTPCKPGTKNICIFGACTKVGCDFVIGSDAIDDICGVCNGDGTECEIVENFYNDTGHDYQEVAIIPSESRNIVFEELGMSPNIIALKDMKSDRFLLNGEHKESPDMTINVDQTEALYRHPEPNKERLVIKGPLVTDKALYVCFFEPFTVGYKFRYARMITDTQRIGLYHWEVLEYEKCSANCEGGIQEPIIGCVEEKQGKVSPRFCRHVKKSPAEARKCNELACRTRWRIGKWGKCHACAFQSGVRTRRVECVKESPHPGGEETLEDDKECKGPRPASRELCNSLKTSRCLRKTTLGIPNRQLRDVWDQIRKVKSIENLAQWPNEIDCLRETETNILNPQIIPDDFENVTEKSLLTSESPHINLNKKISTDFQQSGQKATRLKKPIVWDEEKTDDECYEPENNITSSIMCGEDGTGKDCPMKFFHIDADNNKIDYSSNDYEISTKKSPSDDGKQYESEDSDDMKVVRVNVGDLHIDKKDSIATKVIEVPFKETSLSINASDWAFEELGDQLGDELLINKAKTLNGEDARKETNKIRQKLNNFPEEP